MNLPHDSRIYRIRDAAVCFEPATPERMPGIMRLETAIFAHEQAIPEDLIPLAAHHRPVWWCARIGGDVVGAVAAWIDRNQWHWGRFAVDPRLRGQGIGQWLAACSLAAIFQLAADTPDADPDAVYIDARDAAVRLLLPLGAEITGQASDFHGEPVTPMIVRRSRFRPPTGKEGPIHEPA